MKTYKLFLPLPKRQVIPLIHLLISTSILVLILRTWLVMGLIAPVTVSGSSMAPTLAGPHITASCPTCRLAVDIATDSIPAATHASCPYCQEGHLDWTHATRHPGSRLWIDRGSTLWRSPQRWAVVVFHSPWLEPSPEDAAVLCIKRVLGLPGEQVQLMAGDLLIDGKLQVKTLAEQRRLRRLIRRKSSPVYLPENHSMSETRVLFHAERPLTDEMPYNGRLSRPLHRVHDFMLSAHLTCQGNGQLEWTVNDGRQSLHIQMHLADGAIRLLENQQLRMTHFLSEPNRKRLASGEVTLELSTFDRQVLLAIDGQVELRYPLQPGVAPLGTLEPFTVTSTNLAVTLREVTLWQDVYYGPRPVGFGCWEAPDGTIGNPAGPQTTWQLGAKEFFLGGDNTPVSVDSRIWPRPGIPRHLLVGTLMGGY